MAADPEPDWLSSWRAGRVGTADALRRFDGLGSVEPGEMAGSWRGASLPTGHPLDGLLEGLGWHGKAFEGPDEVHPLLFRRASGQVAPLEPGLMPVRLALARPALARGRLARGAFAALFPVLQTRRHAARLRAREFRGTRSAAIVYAGQPIVDHLRRVDGGRVVGLMERSGMAEPFFFLLTRDADG